jgi:peptide/nickel transport system permease protein
MKPHATDFDTLDMEEKASATGGMSQYQLIRLKFMKHRLAVAGLLGLVVLYFVAVFAEFFAPHTPQWRDLEHAYCPPQIIRFSVRDGLYVRAMTMQVDPVTFRQNYIEEADKRIPLSFFTKGEPYRLWGLIPMQRHFLGVDQEAFARENPPESKVTPGFYLLGADRYGRDVLSRIISGARISLSVGLVGVICTLFFGIIVGGISGYMSGNTDTFIQRVIEVVNALPQLPLWLALGALLPSDWPAIGVYFAITILLSLLNWTSLARVVRGKFLTLREEDYAVAARLSGASHRRIIFRHLLPGMTSHIVVVLTLSVPTMILGETSLSFLGLGLRPPIVSWGVLLQDCMDIKVVRFYPWLLLPAVFIVLAVLCFNFMGDGLRDAADPYAS